MSENYNEDDIELQNAIGDVFKNINIYEMGNKEEEEMDLVSLLNNESHSQEELKQAHQSHKANDSQHHQDFDNNIEVEETTDLHKDDIPADKAPPEEDVDEEDLDINFDDAITDAFRSLQKDQIRHDSVETQRKEHSTQSEEFNENRNNDNDNDHQMEEFENKNDDDSTDNRSEHGDDLDLANAITTALKSIDTILHDHDISKSENSNEAKDKDNNNEQDNKPLQQDQNPEESSTYSPLEVEKNHEEDDDVYDDNGEEADDDFDLQNAIGDAFDSIKQSGELGGNVTHQSNIQRTNQYGDDNRLQSAISEDMLQELAKEITSKVGGYGNLEKNKHLDLPKIDDQVLNHFVSEANSTRDNARETGKGRDVDVDEFDDSQLQSTIENAVKSVISNHESKEDDLNNLQMNDILTNAFNMAMENPTELLNNLETEQIRSKDNLFEGPDLTRRLSIFDSLGSRRPIDLNSQLSSMMQNLSKNNDSNLLTIIKSLTNFLTNSNFQIFKNSLSLISIINQYRHNNFEKLFLNSLNLSKNYLRSNSKLKCIVAIDNILILLGNQLLEKY